MTEAVDPRPAPSDPREKYPAHPGWFEVGMKVRVERPAGEPGRRIYLRCTVEAAAGDSARVRSDDPDRPYAALLSRYECWVARDDVHAER